MKKGDEKRKEYLRVAERLFCQRGYTATSINDILNEMHASKGSFYHHFESKDALLETICEDKAERSAQKARLMLEGVADSFDRLNIVFEQLTPLKKEEISFLAMLLPQMFTKEGRTVSLAWQDALHDAFLPIIELELERASREGVICLPCREGNADLLLTLCNRCSMRALELLLSAVSQKQIPDAGDMLPLLQTYRGMAERLLDAPLGSIQILGLSQWYDAAEGVARHIMMNRDL